jgi:hypothetical protein
VAISFLQKENLASANTKLSSASFKLLSANIKLTPTTIKLSSATIKLASATIKPQTNPKNQARPCSIPKEKAIQTSAQPLTNHRPRQKAVRSDSYRINRTFFCRPKSLDRLIRVMLHSLDLLFLFYQEKRKSPCGGELKDKLTKKIHRWQLAKTKKDGFKTRPY